MGGTSRDCPTRSLASQGDRTAAAGRGRHRRDRRRCGRKLSCLLAGARGQGGASAGSLHVQLLSFDFGAKAQAAGGPAADTLPLGPAAVRLWQEIAADTGDDLEIKISGGLM